MEVPAARHDVRQLRPAHEGGVVAVALRDLLGGAAEQHHGVGRMQAGLGAEGELDLARPELDLERAQRQREAGDVGAQDLQDRVELVVARLGQVLVAVVEQRDLGRRARLARLRRVAQAEMRLLQFEQMEFDLEAGEELVAGVPQAAKHLAIDLPRAERHRPAVGEDDVAQHPAGVRRPRQHAEGRRVVHHHAVRRAYPHVRPRTRRLRPTPGRPCDARCP